jgi:single-strand DNA-binding protein
MSFALNMVTIGGYLTRDPEIRYVPSGAAVANFSIALNETYTKKNGEKVDKVVFVDVTAWEKTAELVGEYLSKGSGVVIVGKLTMEEWDDKNGGGKRTKITVTANEVKFLPRGGDSSEGGGGRGGRGEGRSGGGGRGDSRGGRGGGGRDEGRSGGGRGGRGASQGYRQEDADYGEDDPGYGGGGDEDVPF